MLIHSNNMETTVFIHDCQDFTKTSKNMEESRHFRCSSRSLLLTVVILLGLVVVGIVGLFTVWMGEVTPHLNSPHGPRGSFNKTGKTKSGESSIQIFQVQQSGTYFFYGEVKKASQVKSQSQECKDVVRLTRKTPNTSGTIKEASFHQNGTDYIAVIGAFYVQLKENNNVYLEINCLENDKADYFFFWYISE